MVFGGDNRSRPTRVPRVTVIDHGFERLLLVVPADGMPLIRQALNAIVEECGGSESTRAVREGCALLLLAADYLAGLPYPVVSLHDLPMAGLNLPKNLSENTTGAELAVFFYKCVERVSGDPTEWLSQRAIDMAIAEDPVLSQKHQLAEAEKEAQAAKSQVADLLKQLELVRQELEQAKRS